MFRTIGETPQQWTYLADGDHLVAKGGTCEVYHTMLTSQWTEWLAQYTSQQHANTEENDMVLYMITSSWVLKKVMSRDYNKDTTGAHEACTLKGHRHDCDMV
jgi:hypothetical protein